MHSFGHGGDSHDSEQNNSLTKNKTMPVKRISNTGCCVCVFATPGKEAVPRRGTASGVLINSSEVIIRGGSPRREQSGASREAEKDLRVRLIG